MPLTIQAIVCAVDFSSFSPLVVAHGVVLARRAGARLYLIHAVHHPQDGVHPTTVFERGGDLAQFSDDARQRMAALMAHAPVDWEAVVRFGDPVEQTVAFVNDLPSSLVVSASHGVPGFRRLFIGTVVERLTRQLDSPMLVLKPTAGEDHNQLNSFHLAVVSCDGHGHWQQMAPLLPLLQIHSDSRIHLVHALEGPMGNSVRVSDTAPYDQVQQVQNDRLHRQLHEQGRRLCPQANQLSVTVAPGVPQEMMLQIARELDSDVIVVGVRRAGKLGRWISGSTTEALLRHCPCSVLTVPESLERKIHGGLRR